MEWTRLSVQCPVDAVEAVVGIMLDVTDAGPAVEEAGGSQRVSVYLPQGADLAGICTQLVAALQRVPEELSGGPLAVEQLLVREEDWAHAWKEFYHPMRLGRRLVIKPTWEPWPPADDPSAAREDDLVIELDPQMAFGTGSHPSTQLCLVAVEDLVLPGHRVLDVGCGSGILSLAAAALGALQVVAVDVDPVAVQTSRNNIGASPFAPRIDVRAGSLEAVPEESFDVIVANINVPVICQIAADVFARLKTGGYLIAAGIVETYLPAPVRAVEAAGFVIPDIRRQEGWACIIARKGAD